MSLYIGDKRVTPAIYLRKEGVKLQTKTVTLNGEVTADLGYDGLSKVTVAVEGGEVSEAAKEALDIMCGLKD